MRSVAVARSLGVSNVLCCNYIDGGFGHMLKLLNWWLARVFATEGLKIWLLSGRC